MSQDSSRYKMHSLNGLLVSLLDSLANRSKPPASPFLPVGCSAGKAKSREDGAISTFPTPFKGQALPCDLPFMLSSLGDKVISERKPDG